MSILHGFGLDDVEYSIDPAAGRQLIGLDVVLLCGPGIAMTEKRARRPDDFGSFDGQSGGG